MLEFQISGLQESMKIVANMPHAPGIAEQHAVTLAAGGLKLRPMTLPDRFIDHDSHPKQLAHARLTQHIVNTVLSTLGSRNAHAARA
jgi:deoxyxylulose-5-phosphate synthase